MSYTVTLKDRRTIVVDDKITPKQAVLAAMSNGTPVGLNGIAVSGSMIATVEDGDKDADYGPHLAQNDQQDLFTLTSAVFDPKNAKFFFNAIVRRNMTKSNSAPFYHNSVIDWALSETSYTTPEDILSFLDSEWETAKNHNIPPKPRHSDAETKRLTREYLATEAGEEYARKARMMGIGN